MTTVIDFAGNLNPPLGVVSFQESIPQVVEESAMSFVATLIPTLPFITSWLARWRRQ